MVKLNHNEFLTYPNDFDQIMFGQVKQARDMGAVAVGATIYFGSPESKRQIVEVSQAFATAHELGLATILWCYLRNSGLQEVQGRRARLPHRRRPHGPGQPPRRHDRGRHHQAEAARGRRRRASLDLNFGKTDKRVYSELMTPHPIDMTRYQLANCYMGRAGLINSGGASGANDLQDAVKTAVINKRAGGIGLISGRKAFQKPLADGIELLNAIQDVYLSPEVTVA